VPFEGRVGPPPPSVRLRHFSSAPLPCERQDGGMSHQGYEGWFPECVVCGMGNLRGVICMTPLVDERHGLTPIVGPRRGDSELFGADNHWWKRCLLCDTVMCSDAFSWGSLAYCIECWNHFTKRGLYPPSTGVAARRMTAQEWAFPPEDHKR
jgi:hypothetical protein